MSARVKDIRKYHAWSAENVILKGNAFVYGNIVLDFAGVSYDHILTDDNVLADIAIVADGSPRENMGEMPYPGTFSDSDIIIDNGSGMDMVVSGVPGMVG
jgi:hypothetical protein